MGANKEVMTDVELMAQCLNDAETLRYHTDALESTAVATIARTLFEHRACQVDLRWEREGVESECVDAVGELRDYVFYVMPIHIGTNSSYSRGRYTALNDVLKKLDELEGK